MNDKQTIDLSARFSHTRCRRMAAAGRNGLNAAVNSPSTPVSINDNSADCPSRLATGQPSTVSCDKNTNRPAASVSNARSAARLRRSCQRCRLSSWAPRSGSLPSPKDGVLDGPMSWPNDRLGSFGNSRLSLVNGLRRSVMSESPPGVAPILVETGKKPVTAVPGPCFAPVLFPGENRASSTSVDRLGSHAHGPAPNPATQHS